MRICCNCFFAPGKNNRMTDTGLLMLRLWLGATMLLNHGWGKLTGFSEMKEKFPDIFGMGSTAGLVLAIFAEVICAALLAAGLITRVAALMLAATMLVAFGAAHQFALSGPASGELAFIYMAGFTALLLAGPGRFSVDAMLFKTRSGESGAGKD